MDTYDLICIGCGPAGEKAATQAAYYKKSVAVIEAHAQPGGAMVNTGTIPSKALRETSLLCSAFRRRPIPGIELSLDRAMSVPRFMAQRHLVEQQEHDRIESSFDRHDIDVFHGRGRLVDAHTVEVCLADGRLTELRGEHILIATGSSPLRPAHIPFDHPSVVDADGVLELERLPASMLVVGGGVIGCEYACVFAEIDVPVTLVHPRGEILPFVDAECREALMRTMQDRGIDFRLNTAVSSVTPIDDTRVRVEFENGGEVETEVLLWAAGRQSNTPDLGLEDVGVELGDRGLVKVDGQYRTNVESISAVGDVIGFPALAATSMEQGRIAVCHMFGLGFKEALAETMPIGLYTVPAVSMVGQTAIQALESGREIVTGRALYRHNVRGRMLGDAEGILKCVFDRHTRELLGCTIVGEQATELIHLALSTMSHGAGIDAFIGMCFNYPSLSELYKYAAYNALQQLAEEDGADGEMAGRAKVA